jgi:hypothetical protein
LQRRGGEVILLGEVDGFSLGIFSAQKRPCWVVLVLIGIGCEYVALYHSEIFLMYGTLLKCSTCEGCGGSGRVTQS